MRFQKLFHLFANRKTRFPVRLVNYNLRMRLARDANRFSGLGFLRLLNLFPMSHKALFNLFTKILNHLFNSIPRELGLIKLMVAVTNKLCQTDKKSQHFLIFRII